MIRNLSSRDTETVTIFEEPNINGSIAYERNSHIPDLDVRETHRVIQALIHCLCYGSLTTWSDIERIANEDANVSELIRDMNAIIPSSFNTHARGNTNYELHDMYSVTGQSVHANVRAYFNQRTDSLQYARNFQINEQSKEYLEDFLNNDSGISALGQVMASSNLERRSITNLHVRGREGRSPSMFRGRKIESGGKSEIACDSIVSASEILAQCNVDGQYDAEDDVPSHACKYILKNRIGEVTIQKYFGTANPNNALYSTIRGEGTHAYDRLFAIFVPTMDISNGTMVDKYKFIIKSLLTSKDAYIHNMSQGVTFKIDGKDEYHTKVTLEIVAPIDDEMLRQQNIKTECTELKIVIAMNILQVNVKNGDVELLLLPTEPQTDLFFITFIELTRKSKVSKYIVDSAISRYSYIRVIGQRSKVIHGGMDVGKLTDVAHKHAFHLCKAIDKSEQWANLTRLTNEEVSAIENISGQRIPRVRTLPSKHEEKMRYDFSSPMRWGVDFEEVQSMIHGEPKIVEYCNDLLKCMLSSMFAKVRIKAGYSETSALTIETIHKAISDMDVTMSISGCGKIWAPDWIRQHGELMLDACNDEVNKFTIDILITRWILSIMYRKYQRTGNNLVITSARMSHSQRLKSDIPRSFGNKILIYTASSAIVRVVEQQKKQSIDINEKRLTHAPGDVELAPRIVGTVDNKICGYVNPKSMKSGMMLTPMGTYIDVDDVIREVMSILDSYTTDYHRHRMPYGVVIHHKSFLLHMILDLNAKEIRTYKCTVLDGARNSRIVKQTLSTSIQREVHIHGNGARIDTLRGMGYRGALLRHLKDDNENKITE